MKQPLELSTRIRYEVTRCIPNLESETTIREGAIISSLRDSDGLRYTVSDSGVPEELDHYPFELWKDIQEVDDWNVFQFFSEDEKWHYYL